MKEIRLKACTLGTNFVLLSMLYYLLHGIVIFRDYQLLLDVTILYFEK